MSLREKSEAEIYCEIKDAFQIFDMDNDGIITKTDEQTILRMFGINPNEKEDKNNKKEDKKQKEGEQQEDEENAEEGEDAKNAIGNNGEEEKAEEPKIETVEFNEFFDNIQRKLKDALKDNEILEEIDNGTIMNIRELEHDLQGCKGRGSLVMRPHRRQMTGWRMWQRIVRTLQSRPQTRREKKQKRRQAQQRLTSRI